MTPEVRIVEGPAELAEAAAGLLKETAERALRAGQACAVALSGGSTPQALFRLLAGEPWRSRVPWHAVDFFWGDERLVPFDDAESNFGTARRLLFGPIRFDEEGLHPIPADRGEAAAAAYEEELKAYFGGLPDFDLLFLGLGPDGHTASLFPGSPALSESSRWTAAVTAPKPPPRRVTLTYPVLNAAKRAVFLVAGADKAPALRRVLEGADLPAAKVRPPEVLWLADKAAAAELSGTGAPRP